MRSSAARVTLQATTRYPALCLEFPNGPVEPITLPAWPAVAPEPPAAHRGRRSDDQGEGSPLVSSPEADPRCGL
eukprot:1200447-Alexandrium_andersonii.AAC.1